VGLILRECKINGNVGSARLLHSLFNGSFPGFYRANYIYFYEGQNINIITIKGAMNPLKIHISPDSISFNLILFIRRLLVAERILKVRKKSGNRERCRKLSL